MLNHKGTENLQTSRLLLRRFDLQDINDMYTNWASDPEVAQYVTWSAHENQDITTKIIRS